MNVELLKCKIHRATVTDADLNYEGSVSIDPDLIAAAGLYEFEKVDVLNCNNGERLTTYVIVGKAGEICLNGPAARKVTKGDKVIICAYASMTEDQVKSFRPTLVFVDENNRAKSH